MVLGIGEAGYYPAGTALLSDYFSRTKRAQVMSRWTAGSLIGLMIGFIAGGVVAGLGYGMWRLAFLFTGIPGLVLAFLAYRLREPRRNQADEEDHDDATAQKLGFQGGTIEGPTHFSQFAPLCERIWGKAWFETGCLSAHYRNPAFEGEEVFCPTKSLTVEVENTPGAWAGRASLTGVNCVTVGQNIRLTAIYATPTPAAGTDYMWEFGDQSVVPNTQHPVNSQVHGYARADSYAAGVTLNIPGCSTLLTKPVDVCWACPTGTATVCSRLAA